MNDKELADKVVALGIGSKCKLGLYDLFPGSRPFTYTEFIRDWQIVGALMEKCRLVEITKQLNETHWLVRAFPEHGQLDETIGISVAVNKLLPRAIIEACCEALSYGADNASSALCMDS